MKWQGFLLVALIVVVLLGLRVWRGHLPDTEHSEQLGNSAIIPENHLASPATLPGHVREQLARENESLPSPDKRRLQIVDEILLSKNDNDPRLDSEFRNLSPEFKRALERKYITVPREKLNERGTLVFLLGREIGSPRDMAFMERVAKEAPCLGLLDCRQEQEDRDHGDSDEVINERTLVYPQTVAMKSLERYLKAPGVDSAVRERALKLLREMAHHSDRRLSVVAQEILQRHRL